MTLPNLTTRAKVLLFSFWLLIAILPSVGLVLAYSRPYVDVQIPGTATEQFYQGCIGGVSYVDSNWNPTLDITKAVAFYQDCGNSAKYTTISWFSTVDGGVEYMIAHSKLSGEYGNILNYTWCPHGDFTRNSLSKSYTIANCPTYLLSETNGEYRIVRVLMPINLWWWLA